jgi:FtsH-binding integral membrane protein
MPIVSRNTFSQTTVLNQSFGWMTVGLMVTALSALFISSSPKLVNAINSNGFIYIGLIAAELIIVFVLSSKVRSMTSEEAIASFLVFSFLNGVTLSSILLVYTTTSIVSAFFTAAILFGIMAVYGYTTKRDLTGVGSLGLMLLIGIIIAYFINFFLKSSSLSYALSFIGIIVFIGLTAYDAQKIKQMGEYSDNSNLGILGALTLYLDFINIFLDLLRLFGQGRED